MVVELARDAWPAVPGRAGADSDAGGDARGHVLVIVPLGSTEQHGPHLPFDTDTAIAAEVARRTAAEIDPDGASAADSEAAPGVRVVLAPPIAYGASGEHQDFPGTLSIGSEVLARVIVEFARSARTWADRLVVVNGHGGNAPALAAAVAQLRAEEHDAAWAPCGVMGGDAHAGRVETSIMLALRPDAVGAERPHGTTAPIAELLPRLRAEGVRAVAPDGVLGDATDATAEDGERYLAAMTASVVRRIRADVVDAHGVLRDPGASGPIPGAGTAS